MKKVFTLLIASICYLISNGQPPSQRIFFSSGAGSNASMPVAIGEPLYGQSGGVRIGSQQNNKYSHIDTFPTGILQMGAAKDRIAFYPNPSAGELNVLVQGIHQENYSVVLYDMLGKQLINKRNLSQVSKLGIENLPEGNYNVVVFSADGKNLFSQIINKQKNQ